MSSQKVAYENLYRTVNVPPKLVLINLPPETLKSYKTVKAGTEIDPKFGVDFYKSLQSEANNPDIYAVTYVYDHLTSTNKETGDIFWDLHFRTAIYDPNGTKLWQKGYIRKDVKYKDPDGKSIDFHDVAMWIGINDFYKEVNGYEKEQTWTLAYLEKVKDPPLKEFADQVRAIKTAIKKNPLSLISEMEKYTSKWTALLNYDIGEKSAEVKKAAMHNLILLNILKDDFNEAKILLEKYKLIDGSGKSFLSFADNKAEEFQNYLDLMESKAVTKNYLRDHPVDIMGLVSSTYLLKLKGSIKFTPPKSKESVEKIGEFLMPYLPTYPFEESKSAGVISLDKTSFNPRVTILLDNEDPLEIGLKNVSEIVVDNENYIVKTTWNNKTYGLCKIDKAYNNVQVLDTAVPEFDKDFLWVKKKDTDEAYASIGFTPGKSLLKYLADCEKLAIMEVSGEVSPTVTPLKSILDIYDKCK